MCFERTVGQYMMQNNLKCIWTIEQRFKQIPQAKVYKSKEQMKN